MLAKILVANRGEIAVRVMRTAREMGIKTVAVFADDDREALHVRAADEAHGLGAGGSRQTYLVIEKLLDVARRAGCDAVHPGYGFLSENADFARACEKAGLAFIGPPASAIESMGSKVAARKVAQRVGVPVTPGSPGPVRDERDALVIAHDVGYPLLLKASYGGGGMGMNVVEGPGELAKKFHASQQQALSAFGNGELLMERFIRAPRHIEVQVLADRHGHAVHVGERECSIQRRYQKVVEECPSPAVTPELRERMGRDSIRLAQAVGYQNAGTCEFIYEGGQYYFNEVNTRLQVEHPVTELVYGVDLVREQIRIAAGEELGYTQADLQPRGHAIEARINAEDPLRGFAPSPGRVTRFQAPLGPGVRFDTYLYEGFTVPSTYDSLVGKLAAWGATRDEASRRLARALDELVLEGFATNVALHRAILASPEFQRGDLDTTFLARSGVLERLAREHAERARLGKAEAAAVALAMQALGGLEKFAAAFGKERPAGLATGTPDTDHGSGWRRAARLESLRRGGWR